MATTHGGKRPNAGRKRTRERFVKPVEQAEKQIADRLPELIEILFKLAEGGDYKSAAYLVDRVLGKPRQSVDAELTGKDGEDLRITVKYADAGTNDHAAPAAPRPADSAE